MRKLNRLSLLSLLIPAGFTGNALAQEAVRDGNWSDSSTWAGGALPRAGDIVTIGAGLGVVLDVSPPGLNGINVEGRLSFSNDVDVDLTTEWIVLTGELAIGSEARPHTRNATITFTDNIQGEDVMAGMGDRGIMISGGTLNLHGDTEHTWTKLSETAEAGSTAPLASGSGSAKCKVCGVTWPSECIARSKRRNPAPPLGRRTAPLSSRQSSA